MSEFLSAEQIEEFREAFQIFDADNSGSIGTDELREVLKSLGQHPSDEELDEMILEVDTDGNGVLEFNEFLTLMATKIRSADTEEELVEAFKIFDRDGDQLLNKEDLKKTFEMIGDNWTDEDITEMIKLVDPESSEGRINFTEFCKMMTQPPPR